MSDHTKMGKPSLWLPEPDPVLLLALGKLAEEACELGGRAARCMIQGLEAHDPEDGRHNSKHLAEEIADVRGLSALVMELAMLNDEFVQARADRKYAHKGEWLDMVRDHLAKQSDQSLAQACKPYEHHTGDVPRDDSPLLGVYDAGVGKAIGLLANLLGVDRYTGEDGSESWEGDVQGTIRNVLMAAKVMHPDTNEIATHEVDETGMTATPELVSNGTLRQILGIPVGESVRENGRKTIATHDGEWRYGGDGPGMWRFWKNPE